MIHLIIFKCENFLHAGDKEKSALSSLEVDRMNANLLDLEQSKTYNPI